MNAKVSPPRRLLIFDDDPAIGQTFAAIAETVNFESHSTTQSADFFRILKEWNPTHIALDLVMPGVDGIEALGLLGDLECRAEIIITSGMGSRVLDAARRAAAEHGLSVAGVIAKPFPAAELRALLTKTPVVVPAVGPARIPVPQDDLGEFTEDELAGALDRHELRVFYQPIIECAAGALAGFEALARWTRANGQAVSPDVFIPFAESTGLIDRLSDQVVSQAMAGLAAAFPDTALLLSLNLSARSLSDETLADRIAEACRQHAIAPARIILEITETSAMSHSITTLDLVTRFRIKGFQLSIDDFGVGYSSLVQLARLPFSELKIDKTFVISAQKSKESRSIVKAIVSLAHSLELRVTAEGVEDEWTLGFLKELHCDLAQGFHISRPMEGGAAEKWVRERILPDRHGSGIDRADPILKT
jgi:EAL domain-containing protein (putative c-di-GMP-specific phosphodiesterase class I)/ActR/RegA family two-component response regulator